MTALAEVEKKLRAYDTSGEMVEKFLAPLAVGREVIVNQGKNPSHRYTIYNSFSVFLRFTERRGFERRKESFGDSPSTGWEKISASQAFEEMRRGNLK